MAGKYYTNSLEGTAGYEISAIAPIDSRMIVEFEKDLGGDCYINTSLYASYGTVTTWNETPCYIGMTVYVVDTKEMWVLTDSYDGQTPKTWLKIASATNNVIKLQITGDDI
jgi:hypothetical protein